MKYCIFHHIPGPKLCLNWYLMNCWPYHLYKAGISSALFIEQEMSCDLAASSELLVGLGTRGCACCRWDQSVRAGPWNICSSAAVVWTSSFSMPGGTGSLGLEVQRADEKMVFCCYNLLQLTCTGLSDITCCWLVHKNCPLSLVSSFHFI